jgi:hypothetical protein
MMQTLLTSEIYGVVSLGTILGLLLLTSQLGSGIGPALVGLLEDTTGSYVVPFTVTSLLTYLAAACILLARPPPRSRGATTSPRSLLLCARTVYMGQQRLPRGDGAESG